MRDSRSTGCCCVFLLLTAFGGSFIKPSVLGTVAVTTTEKSRSLGFAIYYWLVNMGALIGPTIAYFVRDSLAMNSSIWFRR